RKEELCVCVCVCVAVSELERDGFGPNPFFQCLVAEVAQEHCSPEGHTVVGYALYFYTYSTWRGRCVYMEDLYVMPNFRGVLVILTHLYLYKYGLCVRLQFSVLDWNKPSLEFYLSKGAQDLTDKEGWHFLRFDGEALDNLKMIKS
uniref:Spermidine/spermine N1-acetyltransferase family member 2 n=1 Tax=Astyanax mexicanus TaxID=7994 RepID=A0A3B1J298_ASTMX